MAGITGLGTTYNLPNYTGLLFALTPAETPFFSSIGGLSAGGQTSSTEFEWEAYDLRAPGQNVALEGAAAPTAQERVRSNIKNLVQIAQEKVSVSYSKLAAAQEKSGVNNDAVNPISNELDWQVEQMLKQMVRDTEWSFLNGRYHLAADNTEYRKTRGLRQAITTNVASVATTAVASAAVVAASGDTVTVTSHGLSNGARIYLRNVTATGLSDTIVYYLVNTATNTFKLSLTLGGSAVDVTVDGVADVFVIGTAVPDTDVIGSLLQQCYDNGGIADAATSALLVNSTQKRAITKAYANAYGKFHETNRNVGGVDVETIETDFGTLNIMLNRMMPQHELVVCSLEQCRPVFREIPGKGHFFAEPLAKTGASDEVQLYGEVGLAYGSERSHAVVHGLAV